jgi:hypothetical protein
LSAQAKSKERVFAALARAAKTKFRDKIPISARPFAKTIFKKPNLSSVFAPLISLFKFKI